MKNNIENIKLNRIFQYRMKQLFNDSEMFKGGLEMSEIKKAETLDSILQKSEVVGETIISRLNYQLEKDRAEEVAQKIEELQFSNIVKSAAFDDAFMRVLG
jgi:hypothetical protein